MVEHLGGCSQLTSPAHHLYYLLTGLHGQIASTFLAKGHTHWFLEYLAMLPAKLDDATYSTLLKAARQHCNATALEHVVQVRLQHNVPAILIDCPHTAKNAN